MQEILSHGGDILKFSGDAFLVQFKVTSAVSLSDATHRAIDTAIIIQKSFGVYETEVGVTLRVKIAIAAGEVCFALIGTEDFSHYVTIGQPVWKVKIAERIADAGDIIVNFLGKCMKRYSEHELFLRFEFQLGIIYMKMSIFRSHATIRCTSE